VDHSDDLTVGSTMPRAYRQLARAVYASASAASSTTFTTSAMIWVSLKSLGV
jgi:hypothetical protein